MEKLGSGIQLVDSRKWILKTRDGWKGFDPEAQACFTKNIYFGGEIDWDTNFNCLVISDQQSKSINLIHTIQSFIHIGTSLGLSDPDWIQVFLLLGKKHLPLIFPSLCRHGNNLDALFTELISNVNQETKIAKIRSALSGISRKANEQVQISLFRVKSLYTMLLSINHPNFSEGVLFFFPPPIIHPEAIIARRIAATHQTNTPLKGYSQPVNRRLVVFCSGGGGWGCVVVMKEGKGMINLESAVQSTASNLRLLSGLSLAT